MATLASEVDFRAGAQEGVGGFTVDCDQRLSPGMPSELAASKRYKRRRASIGTVSMSYRIDYVENRRPPAEVGRAA